MPRSYDLFLSYNRRDQDAVRQIHEALKRRGLKPWFDKEALLPGRLWQEEAEKGIKSCKAAAVFIGPGGIGPWENLEMRALVDRVAKEALPLIPVLLPGAPEKPELPGFVAGLNWVDLRNGITDEGIDELDRGIPTKKKRSKLSSKPVSLGPPPLHNLPYPPLGDLLKGRDEELRKIAESLEVGRRAAIVQHKALYGLGGIGKTRLAVEYAWEFGSRYRAAFFVRADTPEGLRSGLAILARADLLKLEERKAQDEDETVHAVLGWLKENPGWLLILDNVDTKEAESAVLALLPALTGGRVLITSRLRGWPHWVQTQALDTISLEEARAFLLQRTNGHRRSASDDAKQAGDLAQKLDGLPLALEQAGAYIVHTRLSFSEYLEAWKEERERVLKWYDPATMEYQDSVAVTWQRSFDRLKPTTASLLRLSAFLAPDPIPEEIFKSGKEIIQRAAMMFCAEAGQKKDRSSIPEALAELESYSLIIRQEAAVSVHRVMQEVLQDQILASRRKDWITAALQLIENHVRGEPSKPYAWPIWSTLRAHAARIVHLADAADVLDPTSELMRKLGSYLMARGLYSEAEPLLRRALALEELSSGSDSPQTAIHLNELSMLLKYMGRYREAEPMMRRAFATDEAYYGKNHINTARNLNNLGLILHGMNQLSEAEKLMRRALSIIESLPFEVNREMCLCLNNLAQVLSDMDRFNEAESLMRQALEICKKKIDRYDPSVALNLLNLALLLKDKNRSSEAKPLMERAVTIYERSLGLDHPSTKKAQTNLVLLLEEIASQDTRPPAPEGGDSV